MNTIVGKRRSGKTTEAIKLAFDTNVAIIVPNAVWKHDVFEFCKNKFGKQVAECMKIFTVSDIIEGKHRGRKYNGFVIDEADRVFEQLLHYSMGDCGFIAQFLTPDREIIRKDLNKEE